MQVGDLLQAIQKGTLHVTGITHDSRKVQPGHVFVAINGKLRNGHDFIEEAVRKQAACIVAESTGTEKVPTYVTDSPRHWLAPLSAAIYQNPSKQMHLIGITGSNGKTTIASMIHSFFREQGIPCGLMSTVENEINGVKIPAALTTPEAPDLQKMLRDLLDGGTRHAVMEVSAQGVEMERVAQTDFAIGIFTNLTPDHLDFHLDMDAYLASKKRFMQSLTEDRIGIYNIDDPTVKQAHQESHGRTFTYSLFQPTADLSVRELKQDTEGSVFYLQVSPELLAYSESTLESIPFQISLPGLHNVSNALAAILAGILSKIEPQTMQNGLAHFSPVVRRMQRFSWNGREVVDDTAMNPGSIQAVLSSFEIAHYRQVQVAFAIRGNRGVEVNRENALVLQMWYHKWSHRSPEIIITSSIDHVGPNDRVSLQEESAFLDTLRLHQVPFQFYPQLPDAIEQIRNRSIPEGLVFLLGAQGMDEGFSILTQFMKMKDLLKGEPA